MIFSQWVMGMPSPPSTWRYPHTSGVALVDSNEMMHINRIHTASSTNTHRSPVVMYFAVSGWEFARDNIEFTMPLMVSNVFSLCLYYFFQELFRPTMLLNTFSSSVVSFLSAI